MDSRQIYKDISIGTAQPNPSEKKTIKHHLIGVKPIKESINAGEYAKLVVRCIEKIKFQLFAVDLVFILEQSPKVFLKVVAQN